MIQAIEHDEFGSCGGDFYARGHIRAIAAAVGADSGELIDEYDAAHPAGRPATLEELSARTPRAGRGAGRHRWLTPVAYLLCLAVIGFAAIRLTSGADGSRHAPASPGRAARTPAASVGPRPTPASSPASPRPTSTPTAAPVTTVTPVSAMAYGPGGTSDGDNSRAARQALSGNPATPWHTDWYTTARFGNLQTGTGLLLGLGRAVTATDVTLELGSQHGADLQLRAGTSLSGMPVVASATDAGGTVRLHLAAHQRIRYLLVWFTLLPPDGTGTYQADISNVTVTGA